MNDRRNNRFIKKRNIRGYLDIDLKILTDSKKLCMDQKINIVVTILTLCSVIISLWTLNEMREQRTATYRPDIVFSEVEYELRWDLSSDFSKLKIDILDNGMSIEKQSIFEHSKITNIGSGAAKNITFSWSDNNIYEYAKKINQSKSLELNYISSNMIELVFNDWSYIEGHSYNTFKYLLPIYDEKDIENSYISFPMYYKYMIAMYMATSLEEDANDKKFMDKSFPPLKGKITYSDIQGKFYSKEIKFVIVPILTEYSQEGTFKIRFTLSQT